MKHSRVSLVVLAPILVALAACGPSTAESDARGRACLERNDLPCAVREFSVAVKASPDDARLRYNLGLSLARAKALEQARTELEAAVRIDPADLKSRQLLDRIHRAIASRNASLVTFD